MTIYIIGINSFIGKNLYLRIRCSNYENNKIFCLTHNELENLKYVTNDDIVINCCGVNKGSTFDEYIDGNYTFLQKIITNFQQVTPYFIHLSSIMVNGFISKPNDEVLTNNMKMFMESKLKGEDYLIKYYPSNKLCIIRPSNIYGYNCEPYYNNILVTIIYESITQKYKLTKLNKNCTRNFLSIDGLVDAILTIIDDKLIGIHSIVSNNNVELDKLVNILYDNDYPNPYEIVDGEYSRPNIPNICNNNPIIVTEDLKSCIKTTKMNMGQLMKIKQLSPIKTLNKLSQPRGDMVEVSSLSSNRLYMITITQNSFRGNHYHDKQIEEFYVHKGKCIFLLADSNSPDIISINILNQHDLIRINPNIIHTLVNDFVGSNTELFVTSTQMYVHGIAVDTTYVNIL